MLVLVLVLVLVAGAPVAVVEGSAVVLVVVLELVVVVVSSAPVVGSSPLLELPEADAEDDAEVVGAALVPVSVLVAVLVPVPVPVVAVAEVVPVFVSPQARARVKQAISGRGPRRCMAHDIAGRGARGREPAASRWRAQGTAHTPTSSRPGGASPGA